MKADHLAEDNRSFEAQGLLPKPEYDQAAAAAQSKKQQFIKSEMAERDAHSMLAASEDSSLSCPGVFTADRVSTPSARQEPLVAAESDVQKQQHEEDKEQRERERLALLKSRKDAAAKHVKEYIDRW